MNSIAILPSIVNDTVECPECHSTHITVDSSRGDRICVACGLVIQEKVVDLSQERKALSYIEERNRNRTSSSSISGVYNKNLVTMIDWRDRDASGNKLDPSVRAKIYRMRKWQLRTRSRSPIERKLGRGVVELDRISAQLTIPREIKEAAAILYRKVLEKNLTRGRSIDGMVCATIYAACRSRSIPRYLEEIALSSRVEKKEISRCYRLLLRELNLKLPQPSVIDFVARFGAELQLSGATLRKAIEYIKKAKIHGITLGKEPAGLAAAALYVSSVKQGEYRTQREIARVAHVTEVTVRNRYKELEKW